MTEVIVKLTGSGDWEVPEGVTELADVLLVAGGGGAGRSGSRGMGGGGAGGVKLLKSVSVTPGQIIAYSVGEGGESFAASPTDGWPSDLSNGKDTFFGGDLAKGGGHGGGAGPARCASNGGSGGGGGANDFSGWCGTPGTGEVGQGNDGGAGAPSAGGGGGGADEPGSPALVSTTGGDGGVGSYHGSTFGNQYGDAGWFGGGGAGSSQWSSGEGGKGGGGDAGDAVDGSSGMPETGGGGGGASKSGSVVGGSGGSGTILIRYFLPDPGTSTGTGTGTGIQPQLTPLNLFLVSITLPDEPFEEPEPEPALSAFPTDGLFEYFRFSEGAGLSTTGINGQEATLSGAIGWAAPLILDGGSVDSDQPASQGGIVEVDQEAWLNWTRTNPFSVSLWFKETREGPRNDLANYIFAPRRPTSSTVFGPWRIITSSSSVYPVLSSILFELRSNSSTIRLSAGAGFKSLDEVYHVVVTCTGSVAELWVDGVKLDEASGLSLDPIDPTVVTTVFGDEDNESLAMLGQVSGLAVFDRVLSPSEIANIYNEGEGTWP